jgi:hypothetical protein
MKPNTPEELKALAKISKRMKARVEKKRFKKRFIAFKDYNDQDETDLSFMSHING